jgi:DNA-nicking Smr family endonuclease
MTREVAYQALVEFLQRHYARQSRCLLIITGKGSAETGGVLRAALPRWLDEPGIKSLILALDVARPKHGGSGAYYVLLRRKR